MKEYARGFYKSKQWRETSRAYMTSQAYICERCGAVADICHHKKYITPTNITDPYITLNFDNLEALCQDCHNKEHSLKRALTCFDDDGNIASVKDSGTMADYKKQVDLIDKLLEKIGR